MTNFNNISYMKLTKIEKSRLEIWNFFIRSVHKYQTWIENRLRVPGGFMDKRIRCVKL